MLIKKHPRNLYKASSVMIYMQMNPNVLGIHYGGFWDFYKIHADRGGKKIQPQRPWGVWSKDPCPFLIWSRAAQEDIHLGRAFIPTAAFWAQRQLKNFLGWSVNALSTSGLNGGELEWEFTPGLGDSMSGSLFFWVFAHLWTFQRVLDHHWDLEHLLIIFSMA